MVLTTESIPVHITTEDKGASSIFCDITMPSLVFPLNDVINECQLARHTQKQTRQHSARKCVLVFTV